MLTLKIENGHAVNFAAAPVDASALGDWETRHDWKTMEVASKRAAELSAAVGGTFLAIDNGPNVWPRFDIIQPPAVGDEVSYSFNGDTYPDGKIIKVSDASKQFRIVKTDTGSTYYRRKQSGRWVKKGGTWSLVQGHKHELNPSF